MSTFANTLEEGVEAVGAHARVHFAGGQRSRGNQARNPIMVRVGNPPYLWPSANRSRPIAPGSGSSWTATRGGRYSFPWRTLKVVARRLREFVSVSGGKPIGNFFGILAIITNTHGFLENPDFAECANSVMRTFTDVYLLDLHGRKARRDSARPDGIPDGNVIIKLGKMRHLRQSNRTARQEFLLISGGTIEEKYGWLAGDDTCVSTNGRLEPLRPFI